MSNTNLNIKEISDLDNNEIDVLQKRKSLRNKNKCSSSNLNSIKEAKKEENNQINDLNSNKSINESNNLFNDFTINKLNQLNNNNTKKHNFNNIIQINAESLGIKSLNNEIIDFLNLEVDYKLKEILNNSKKYMRVSKRKTLKSDDINNSLSYLNFKRIIGYDSYANIEYDTVDQYKGFWKHRQNIVDLDDYISKPIVSCPMDSFPHFHWLAIQGIKPNIAENFIKEDNIEMLKKDNYNIKDQEVCDVINKTDKLKSDVNYNYNIQNNKEYLADNNLHLEENVLSNINTQVYNSKSLNYNGKIIIHNLSKELQIFLENFEIRFRKEIKKSKIENINNEDSNLDLFKDLSPELTISLSALKSEPGIVELLPYIIEFLMELLNNKQNLKEPKILLLIIYTLNSIMQSSFYNLDPYIHQIAILILSIFLLNIDNKLNEELVFLKNECCKILLELYRKCNTKYSSFKLHVINMIKKNLNINLNNPKFSVFYSCLKFFKELGSEYVIKYVYPNLKMFLVQLYNLQKIYNNINDNNNISSNTDLNNNLNNKGSFNSEKEHSNNKNNVSNKHTNIEDAENNNINFSNTFDMKNFKIDLNIPSIPNTFSSNISYNNINEYSNIAANNKTENINNLIIETKKVYNKSREIYVIYYLLRDCAKLIISNINNIEKSSDNEETNNFKINEFTDKNNDIINNLKKLFGNNIIEIDLD